MRGLFLCLAYGFSYDLGGNRLETPAAQYGVAEGVGFEPTIRYNRIPDFESGAFDLSATLPRQERKQILPGIPQKSKAAGCFCSDGLRIARTGRCVHSRKDHHFAAGSMRSLPFMYGRRASGIVTAPSAFW